MCVYDLTDFKRKEEKDFKTSKETVILLIYNL